MIFYDCNRFIETSMRQGEERRGEKEWARVDATTARNNRDHCLAKTVAVHQKPSSVVDRPQSHLSKENVGMHIVQWADRWQAVCASAPLTSRHFLLDRWLLRAQIFKPFVTCLPSVTDDGKGVERCASCTRERCKRWHARTTQKAMKCKKAGRRPAGGQKLSLQVVSAKRSTLEFQELQD